MKNCLTILCLFVFGFLCTAQDHEDWIEDINYYQNTLETKHIDLYHRISKPELILEIDSLKSNLFKLTDFQIITELMRITQRIGGGKGDGHTAVPLWNRALKKYPIQLFDFDGDVRVIGITEAHQQYLGNKLICIDGVAIEDIYKQVSKLTPFTENKYSLKDRTCSYLIISELLNAINITKRIEAAEFTFANDNGEKETIVLESYTKEALAGLSYETLSLVEPRISQPKDLMFENLWFTALNDFKTIYINFKTYPSEEAMNVFSEKVYKYIQEHKSEHLIIDLRDNYGGDFYKGLTLSGWLNACDSINWKSKVYVLINRKTYSAAMVNALQFKQLLNATLVGEPSGANPNGYQDLGQFQLPNSKVLITYTKRLFRLQEKDSEGIQPDVLISSTRKAYNNGFDEVLSWVLHDLHD